MSVKMTVPGITLVVLIVLFSSCAKKQTPDTLANRVEGKWKLVKTATDDNGNGQIDDGEIQPVPPIKNNEKLFNKDGTGVETNVFNNVTSPSLNFHWKIVTADSLWIAYVTNDTLTYYVATVSSAQLTLITNTPLGLAGYYYIKQ